MSAKKDFIGTVITIILGLTVIALFVWLEDPYQQYRTSDKYSGTQRQINPGMASTADYNAIITGSSMAMNFFPCQADSLFSWNSINLSVMGATVWDYDHLFRAIEKAGKAGTILMSLDFFSFTEPDIPLEEYLYDDNRINDIKYLLNYSSVVNAVRKIRQKPVSKNDIFHFNSPLGQKFVLEEYYSNLRSLQSHAKVCAEVMYDKFREVLIPVIQRNKKTRFLIYFPPYSILYFKKHTPDGTFTEWLKFKEMVVKDLLNLENVKAYDFQSMNSLTANLTDYMDLTHHSQKTSRLILDYINNDSCLIRRNNYKLKIDLLKSQVENFVVPE